MAPSREPELHVLAWTEQHPAVLSQLRQSGEFHADGRRVPKAVRPVFGWMRRQMQDRVAGTAGRPLIWLNVVPNLTRSELCDWRCTRRTGDLCSKVHTTPGKDWLQVSIPADRLLRSDFELWSGHVMMYRYVPTDDADQQRWNRRLRRELGLPSGSPIPFVLDRFSDDTMRDVIASWVRIFDTTAGRPTQATVEQLFVDDIVDVLPAPDLCNVPPTYRVNVSTYLRGDR